MSIEKLGQSPPLVETSTMSPGWAGPVCPSPSYPTRYWASPEAEHRDEGALIVEDGAGAMSANLVGGRRRSGYVRCLMIAAMSSLLQPMAAASAL